MSTCGGSSQDCKMAFILPLAISAPASLARIRPCLSLRWRIFTFGNRDIYLSSFSLRYSAGKEERVRLTYQFHTHFQGEKEWAERPWKHVQTHQNPLGWGVNIWAQLQGFWCHRLSLLSGETPSHISASRF